MPGKRCFVLDGLTGVGGLAETAVVALLEEAEKAGWTLDTATLDGLPVQPCLGCFGCWTRTPGICRIDDAGRELAARMARSDLTLCLTPVVFGGFGPSAKTALERAALPTLLPFFRQVRGRTRHTLRYGSSPDLLSVGWLPRADPEQEQVFRSIVARNAANLGLNRHGACVLRADSPEREWRSAVQAAIALPDATDAPEAARPFRAVFLNGSPKPGGGATGHLGAYLLDRLGALGAGTETARAKAVLDDETALDGLLASLDRADVLVLGFPLYADQLPGPVVALLECLSRLLPQRPPERPLFLAALVNCGFPEPANNEAALAVCRLFAREAGLVWLGGCSVGGGAMFEEKSLDAHGFLSRGARRSLDALARRLADREDGQALEPAVEAVSCPLPGWIYRKAADMGWKKGARGNALDLEARPYGPR